MNGPPNEQDPIYFPGGAEGIDKPTPLKKAQSRSALLDARPSISRSATGLSRNAAGPGFTRSATGLGLTRSATGLGHLHQGLLRKLATSGPLGLTKFQRRAFVLDKECNLKYSSDMRGEVSMSVSGAQLIVPPGEDTETVLKFCVAEPTGKKQWVLEAYTEKEKLEWVKVLTMAGAEQKFKKIIIKNGVVSFADPENPGLQRVGSNKFFSEDRKCEICKSKFNKVLRQKQNCRGCGAAVCTKCSTHKAMIKKLGYEARVCDNCAQGKPRQRTNSLTQATVQGDHVLDDFTEEADAGEILPGGWLVQCGPDGTKFYLHEATGKNLWNPPTEQDIAELEQEISKNKAESSPRETADESSQQGTQEAEQ